MAAATEGAKLAYLRDAGQGRIRHIRVMLTDHLVATRDVLARVILSPEELPIGILTAFSGAPFFIWLMRFKGKMLQRS